MNILADIAASMLDQARQHGQAHRILSRGLQLDLYMRRRDGFETRPYMDYLLALSRQDTPPGEQEVAICRHVFGVPVAAACCSVGNWISFIWDDAPVAGPVQAGLFGAGDIANDQ